MLLFRSYRNRFSQIFSGATKRFQGRIEHYQNQQLDKTVLRIWIYQLKPIQENVARLQIPMNHIIFIHAVVPWRVLFVAKHRVSLGMQRVGHWDSLVTRKRSRRKFSDRLPEVPCTEEIKRKWCQDHAMQVDNKIAVKETEAGTSIDRSPAGPT